MAAFSARSQLERRAVFLEAFGVGYNILECVLAVTLGLVASSAALIGFGFDSAIEVTASMVVLVHILRRSVNPEREGRIAFVVGITLLILAGYVAFEAVRDLVLSQRPEESYLGIGVAVASLLIMPWLAGFKHRIAHQIDSRALEAESRETLICAYLSATLLLGLGANAAFGWWWADPIAALSMVAIISREGWEAIRRRELCCLD